MPNNINEEKLAKYIEDAMIEVYDSEADFLTAVNEDRQAVWSDTYPNDFKTFEEAKALCAEYAFVHQNRYHKIAYRECLDVYNQ